MRMKKPSGLLWSLTPSSSTDRLRTIICSPYDTFTNPQAAYFRSRLQLGVAVTVDHRIQFDACLAVGAVVRVR